MIRLTAEEGRRKSYIVTQKGIGMLQEEYERLKMMVEDGAQYLQGRLEHF